MILGGPICQSHLQGTCMLQMLSEESHNCPYLDVHPGQQVPKKPYKTFSTPDQWELQDPKMDVLYHVRPYFVGIFLQFRFLNGPSDMTGY